MKDENRNNLRVTSKSQPDYPNTEQGKKLKKLKIHNANKKINQSLHHIF